MKSTWGFSVSARGVIVLQSGVEAESSVIALEKVRRRLTDHADRRFDLQDDLVIRLKRHRRLASGEAMD